MSTNRPFAEIERQPLRLPAGSLRATMSLFIAALFWLFILLPEEKRIPVPLFLYFLAGMVMLFLVAFRHSEPSKSTSGPWGLPSGVFRFLLVGGTVLVIVLHVYLYGGSPLSRLVPQPEQLHQWPNLTLALFCGLGIGWLVGRGPWRKWAVFQDIQAWVSLIAMLGLFVEVIILLFINPNLERNPPIDLRLFETILTGVIAWYFGSRA
jgi:hypothetical protein